MSTGYNITNYLIKDSKKLGYLTKTQGNISRILESLHITGSKMIHNKSVFEIITTLIDNLRWNNDMQQYNNYSKYYMDLLIKYMEIQNNLYHSLVDQHRKIAHKKQYYLESLLQQNNGYIDIVPIDNIYNKSYNKTCYIPNKYYLCDNKLKKDIIMHYFSDALHAFYNLILSQYWIVKNAINELFYVNSEYVDNYYFTYYNNYLDELRTMLRTDRAKKILEIDLTNI